jgi:hypothetical protein
VRSATIVWNGDDVQDEKKRSAFSLENAKPWTWNGYVIDLSFAPSQWKVREPSLNQTIFTL